jgi:hypothetical protein
VLFKALNRAQTQVRGFKLAGNGARCSDMKPSKITLAISISLLYANGTPAPAAAAELNGFGIVSILAQGSLTPQKRRLTPTTFSAN